MTGPEDAAQLDLLREEVARLQRWKDEALPVIMGLQDLGRALGLRLGTSITGLDAVEAARLLVAERDALTARPTVPPGPCWHDAGVDWPNGVRPRCDLLAGHEGAHQADRGLMGGTAVWPAAEPTRPAAELLALLDEHPSVVTRYRLLDSKPVEQIEFHCSGCKTRLAPAVTKRAALRAHQAAVLAAAGVRVAVRPTSSGPEDGA